MPGFEGTLRREVAHVSEEVFDGIHVVVIDRYSRAEPETRQCHTAAALTEERPRPIGCRRLVVVNGHDVYQLGYIDEVGVGKAVDCVAAPAFRKGRPLRRYFGRVLQAKTRQRGRYRNTRDPPEAVKAAAGDDLDGLAGKLAQLGEAQGCCLRLEVGRFDRHRVRRRPRSAGSGKGHDCAVLGRDVRLAGQHHRACVVDDAPRVLGPPSMVRLPPMELRLCDAGGSDVRLR